MGPGMLVPRGPVFVVLVLVMLRVGVWGEDSESVSVEFGRDVNLTCLLELEDVYWYMDLTDRISVKILRTFHRQSNDADIFIYMLDTKYSTRPGNVLVIHNVTAEDCRVYHCAQMKNMKPQFRKTFVLLPGTTVGVATPTLPTNQSEPQCQHPFPFCQRCSVVIGSLALSAFFMVLVAGVALPVMRRWKKSRPTNDLSPPVPQSPEVPEYEEILLMASGSSVPELSCVYSQAQMPNSY
ncbi:unnamed protein product [Lota lota]